MQIQTQAGVVNVVLSCLLSVVQQGGHASRTTFLHPVLLFLSYRRCVIQVWVPLQAPVQVISSFWGSLVYGPLVAAAVGSDMRTVAANAGNYQELLFLEDRDTAWFA